MDGSLTGAVVISVWPPQNGSCLCILANWWKNWHHFQCLGRLATFLAEIFPWDAFQAQQTVKGNHLTGEARLR